MECILETDEWDIFFPIWWMNEVSRLELFKKPFLSTWRLWENSNPISLFQTKYLITFLFLFINVFTCSSSALMSFIFSLYFCAACLFCSFFLSAISSSDMLARHTATARFGLGTWTSVDYSAHTSHQNCVIFFYSNRVKSEWNVTQKAVSKSTRSKKSRLVFKKSNAKDFPIENEE